jgi:acyl carrier protein
MTDAEIRASVVKALKRIAPETDPDGVPPDEDLREALDIDSMDFNNFVLSLHDALGVDIAEKDYPKLFTLNGCVAELRARLAKPG